MNTFGHSLRLSIFGESHGPAIGIVIDGVPSGLPLHPNEFKTDLERRWPKIKGVSSRREPDFPEIISGLLEGKTTGAPITILFFNKRVDSSSYEQLRLVPRPGQADFGAWVKFAGFNDWRGGGHFSGRLTACLVAAGVIAKKIIDPIKIEAWVEEIGGSKEIECVVQTALKQKDSVGGLIACRVFSVPAGLGEPFFDSLESLLAHLIFSIPGIKGIEFGRGFALSRMRGSEANDPITNLQGKTLNNNNGGIIGGLSNGNEIFFRVAAKPTPSIGQPQKSINLKTGKMKTLKIKGKHDICFALRLPVIIEAAVAIVLADLLLRSQRIPLIWSQ